MTRIGTAGWSIPRAFAAEFPGAGAHLDRYARALNAAEINSSFYRPHRRDTYARWAQSVPSDFRFAVKLPKAISHTARLIDTSAPLDAFVDEVGGLGPKLGVVLLQLPPSFAFEAGVVAAFLAGLRARLDDTVGIACEPRHASWFDATADACLAANRVARVAADPVLAAGGERPGGWGGLHYHRLHGAPRVYYSAYEPLRLAALAASLVEADGAAETWCIFDNTAAGAATGNALATKDLVAEAERARPLPPHAA
jgi:uncharacterized protein YecE (DUF72 family)